MAELPVYLSLTQTSEQSPHIFVNTAGSPLSVYLDVNPEILARPRLIRLLRASGADICHNPSSAVILLINPETESGRKFVHDWSADPHKTVLNYGWIQACLQTRRALLGAEDWGGFCVSHTSDCIYSDEEGDEDLGVAQRDRRRLTTLQPTLENGTSPSTPLFRGKASLNSTRSKLPSPIRPSSEPSVKLDTPSLVHHHPTSVRRGSNSISAQSPLSKLASSAAIISSPKVVTGISPQNSTRSHSVPKHTLPNSPPSQQIYASPPCSVPQAADTPTLAPSLSQGPGPSTSRTFPSTVNYSESQHSPLAGPMGLLHALSSAFQIQNTASQVQNAASQTLTQLVETVIAVAQGQGIDTAIIQNYLATLPMSSSSYMQDPALHSAIEYPGSSVSDTSFRDVGKSSASTYNPRSRVSSEPSLPAKRKRKSPEALSPAKRVTSNSRQNPSEATPEPPPSGRGVFSTKNGRPILLFVQIDTRGRHEIVYLIKKNGGKITADIPNAAFVILNPRSISYADLRQEADDSGRMIVQPSFVKESIERGHLLDPNDFLLGNVGSPRKRRPTFFPDRPSPESDHATSEAQTSDTVVDASSSILARDNTITPEPPAAVQLKNGYKFTPAEMTYTWTLVRRIITKDPLVSKLTVAKTLHKKMPHHSVTSWMTTMTRQKEMYDAVRTEALRLMPASRVSLPISQQSQGAHHPQNETNGAEMNEADRDIEELEELQVGASLVPALGEPVHDNEQQLTPEGRNEDKNESDAYARDFEALVAFLTSADADGGREDEIFERLTAKNICLTAQSWPDFLERHADAVTEEVERRCTTQHAI